MSLFFTLTPKHAFFTRWHGFENYIANCSRSGSQIAASASSLLWHRRPPGLELWLPVFRNHLLHSCFVHILAVRAGPKGAIFMIWDTRSTNFESIHHFWHVLSLWRRRNILINSSSVKFHKNLSSLSVVYSDRRTDGEDLSVFLIV